MQNCNEICGECKYSRYDKESDGSFVCQNSRSDYFAMWIEYDDTCDEFEKRGVE